MRKLKHITEVCRSLYEEKGASAVYDYCNDYIEKYPDSNVRYKQCTACDADTPHFGNECLICGQSNTIPSRIKSPTQCPKCGSNNTRYDYDFPATMSCCDDCGCDYITEGGEIILDPDKL